MKIRMDQPVHESQRSHELNPRRATGKSQYSRDHDDLDYDLDLKIKAAEESPIQHPQTQKCSKNCGSGGCTNNCTNACSVRCPTQSYCCDPKR